MRCLSCSIGGALPGLAFPRLLVGGRMGLGLEGDIVLLICFEGRWEGEGAGEESGGLTGGAHDHI